MEHGEETIRLILPEAGNGPYVEGALNGVNFRIPTGVPVDVPLRIYRVLEDKAGAKEWFDKAYALKDNQIDTLYFLSRYDEEAGNREAALEKLEKAAEGRFSPLNYCGRETILKEIERLKGVN